MKADQTGSLPDFFNGKRVVISGEAGFIGSGVVNWLARTGCDLTRILRSKREAPASPLARIRDIVGDVSQGDLWKDVVAGADIVYHLAAQTSVTTAEADPEADFQSNVLPLIRLLRVCEQERRKPTILFASTVTIFGFPNRVPVDETFPDRPATIYDLHKKMAEDYLKHYIRRGVAKGASLRLANVYGPGPASQKADRGVLNQMVAQALAGQSLTVYGAGDQLRDYIYIDDVVMALLVAAQQIDKLNGEHFVIGTGQSHTVAEAIQSVAERVAAQTGREVKVRTIDPPASMPEIDRRNFVANASRFREATGWKAQVSLAEGIERTIDAALDQKRGI